ncbi:MAG: hypothetical protein BJG00_016175, partial [Limnothrix sp. CACIAM 69d]
KPKEKEFATANTSANTTANAVNGIGIENGIENGIETENETAPEKVGSGGKTAALLPWPSAAFADAWQQWKAYRRKEHSFRYRSAESEQAALMELSALATTGEAQAIAIIRQSMGKGWKGFFELKQHDATPTKAGSRVQYSDDFRRKIAERLQPPLTACATPASSPPLRRPWKPPPHHSVWYSANREPTLPAGFVMAWLVYLNAILNLNKPMTEDQIELCAQEVVDTFYSLKVSDLTFLCKKIIAGHYGEFYESLTIPKVLSFFRDYFEQRCLLAEELSQRAHADFASREEFNLSKNLRRKWGG